jgi:hypothetical protein
MFSCQEPDYDKADFLARSRSTMMKSMGELKKVVVSKVTNNAAENRGNKRKYYWIFFLINLYRKKPKLLEHE